MTSLYALHTIFGGQTVIEQSPFCDTREERRWGTGCQEGKKKGPIARHFLCIKACPKNEPQRVCNGQYTEGGSSRRHLSYTVPDVGPQSAATRSTRKIAFGRLGLVCDTMITDVFCQSWAPSTGLFRLGLIDSIPTEFGWRFPPT